MIVRFWGLMDFAAIFWFTYFSYDRGRIPFVSDILDAIKTGNEMDSWLPPVLVIATVCLYISYAFSGFFLFKKSVIGKYLMYCQLPFRLFFMLPSVFFIPNLLSGVSVSMVLGSMVVAELVKIFSVHWSYRAK